jgi:tight adherence protein C
MSTQIILYFLIIFITVACIAALSAWLLFPDRLKQRLSDLDQPGMSAELEQSDTWVTRLLLVGQPLMKLSQPTENWENSPMRQRFMHAGWRTPLAPTFFFTAKTVLAMLMPIVTILLVGGNLFDQGSASMLLILACIAATGYYLPNMILSHAIKIRQREIFENFPDALDLLIICIEAGMGFELALSRVASEIVLTSKVLAQELQLVQIEMRTGFSKEQALRNLALRNGVEEIDMLVAMLIQSERFGTGMSSSLRVHSENLRTKRRQMTEEAAGKVAIKLLFPLIFFIFPTLLLVLLGPAMLQIYRVLLPAMAG